MGGGKRQTHGGIGMYRTYIANNARTTTTTTTTITKHSKGEGEGEGEGI